MAKRKRTARPRTRDEKQAETRRALIEAATSVFAARGLAEASVDEITQAAGYTRGAFYSNYDSKEQLFVDVMRRRFLLEIEAYSSILRGSGEILDKTRALAAWLAENADPAFCTLVLEFQLQASRDAHLRTSFESVHAWFQKELELLLEEFFARSKTRPSVPVADVAEMLVSLAYGFAVRRVALGDRRSEKLAGLVKYVLDVMVVAERRGRR